MTLKYFKQMHSHSNFDALVFAVGKAESLASYSQPFTCCKVGANLNNLIWIQRSTLNTGSATR